MDQRNAFRILASADRQLVLHELAERDGTVGVDELARRVAARRHRLSSEKLDERQVDQAQLRLVHAHFPHLVEQELIDVDWEAESVELTDEESVDQLFEAADALENWPPTDLLEPPSQ